MYLNNIYRMINRDERSDIGAKNDRKFEICIWEIKRPSEYADQ